MAGEGASAASVPCRRQPLPGDLGPIGMLSSSVRNVLAPARAELLRLLCVRVVLLPNCPRTPQISLSGARFGSRACLQVDHWVVYVNTGA